MPNLDLIRPLSISFVEECIADLADYRAIKKAIDRIKLRTTAKEGLDEIVFKLIEGVDSSFDGRRRTINFFIIPSLLKAGYSNGEIIEACKRFVENSGKSWYEHASYVKSCLKRNKSLSEDKVMYSLKSFLDSFPDIKE